MTNMESVSLDGWFDQGSHIYPLKVQYEDTDAGGVVYHANYLAYAERARSAAFALLNIDQRSCLANGYAFVVASVNIQYHKPAQLGDLIKVVSSTSKMTGVQIILKQNIMSNLGTNLATCEVKVVYAKLPKSNLPKENAPKENQNSATWLGRPVRLDDEVKNKILATMPPQNHGITQ